MALAVNKGIYLEGLEELHETLMVVTPRTTLGLLKHTAADQANKVRDRLREVAPKDTGNLEQAIVARTAPTKNNKPMAMVIIQQGSGSEHDAYYWKFLEYGTSANPHGEPFIFSTVESMRPQVLAAFRGDLERNLADKVAKQARQKAKS